MTRPPRSVFGPMINDSEVATLVDAYYDGYATDVQREKLSALIRESDEVRDFVIAHSQLISELIVIAGATEDCEPDKARREHKVDSQPTLPQPTFWQPASLGKWTLAIAASIALLIAGGYSFLFNEQTVARRVVGTLRQVSAMESGKPSAREITLSEETPLNLREGEYEIRLKNGVVLAVAAPANILVQNQLHCRLDSGRMTATVPKGAEGFRIFTSLAEIVDHGTRFGVSVSPDGDTNVAVFEGNVAVLSSDEQRSLQMGRAVSIASNGLMSRMGVVRPDSFAVSKRRLGPLGPTVLSVSDNIRSAAEMSYYRIVHEGFSEDQRAYVDRVHQWNGLDTSGLPKELVGADYIMTFNDDKAVRNIEITVTLARKADIYVLLDERVDVPPWLQNEFDETELKVGMDEGERPGRPEDPRTLGVGAGQSVDYRFSVWKRKKPSDGKVVFGGLPNMGEWQSMYGILAIPTSLDTADLNEAI